MPEERKLVTILFADTTGSTALGEALDPEDVRALMGRYYAHARRVIPEHGGTLEKFIGDAVMAVFGLPQAHGNDAERALAAALALREAVASDPMLGAHVVLHLGVNTGEVVATAEPTSGDFLVTGDCVNVAGRLYDAADPGEILAGERTRDAAARAFRFGEARLLTVKNKRLPLRAYLLLGPDAPQTVSRPALVGRRADLAQLDVLWQRTLEERVPQLVSIVAPAGTGKTRLLEEFLARLHPKDGFRLATARCVPYGQTLTYWPLRGLLADLLGEAFTPPSVARAFTDGGLSAEDAQRLAGLVLATLGIEGEGEGNGGEQVTERDLLFNAWRLLVEALAQQSPRIVVFEDLHWASESLLDLVEHLMQPRTEAALLIVATSRPELLDRRPTWGGGRRNFTALTLAPLNVAQAGALVGKLAKKAPQAIRAQIVERSGGNPYFIIELARTVSEPGMPGQDGSAGLLPDTVQEAVQERLDLLSAPERTVLQAAAVAGRQFRPATLIALLTAPAAATVDAALDGLLARDLITPTADGSYTFRHSLIRDVAYGTLSRAERVRLHVAVATWLETVAADRLEEYVELIAHHYGEAASLARHASVPLDLPVDTNKATDFLARAGELAGRKDAVVEARGYLERALTLAPQEQRMRLYERLGDCCYVTNGAAAVAAYRAAVDGWRAAGAQDALTGARLLRKLLMGLSRWTPPDKQPSDEEISGVRAEALALAEAAGDEDEIWYVRLASLDPVWQRWGVAPDAVRACRVASQAAAAWFERSGNWTGLNEALDVYGASSSMAGELSDVLAAQRRRLAIAQLPLPERGDALMVLAGVHFRLCDFDQCLALMRAELDARRPGDSVVSLARGGATAMWAAVLSGRWAECAALVAILEEAREHFDPRGSSAFTNYLAFGYFAALHVALAQQDRPRVDATLATLARLVATDDASAEVRAILEACRTDDPGVLTVAASQRVNGPIPADYVEFALAFSNERGVPVREPLLTWGRLIAQTPNFPRFALHVEIADALAAEDPPRLARAIDQAEAYGAVFYAARLRIALAQRTGDRTHLERARLVLEQLGDRQFLRRLEEVQGALSSMPSSDPPGG